MRYPAWKYILILLVLIVSTLYSLPNLYPDEPAIQISGANAGIKTDKAVLAQADAALKQAGLSFHGTEIQEKGVEPCAALSISVFTKPGFMVSTFTP